jgi:hypothetical protein
VERLRHHSRDATTVRPSRNRNIAPYLGFATMTIATAVGALMAISLHEPPRPPPAVIHLPPVTAPPVHTVPPVTASEPLSDQPGTVIGASPVDRSDCAAPYWYDARGIKRYKHHCLHR